MSERTALIAALVGLEEVVMLCGAIDLHKHAFRTVVIGRVSGETTLDRFTATREVLGR